MGEPKARGSLSQTLGDRRDRQNAANTKAIF